MHALSLFARCCILVSGLAIGGVQAGNSNNGVNGVNGVNNNNESWQVAELILESDHSTPMTPLTPAAPAKAAAQSNRDRAHSFKNEVPATLIIEADDEEGILSPRGGGSPAEQRAFEQRWRARSFIQDGKANTSSTPRVHSGSTPVLLDAPSNATRHSNRARSYADGTGNWREMDLSQRDKDGIPLVNCRNIDNVSGRIGDDTASGSVVLLVRNGQQIKVKCR